LIDPEVHLGITGRSPPISSAKLKPLRPQALPPGACSSPAPTCR
jgi:hypothetical protein